MMLAIKFNHQGEEIILTGVDLVSLAIKIFKEIEEEPMDAELPTSIKGHGTIEKPYLFSDLQDWLYIALHKIISGKGEESYYSIGKRLIKCNHDNRYVADYGPQKDFPLTKEWMEVFQKYFKFDNSQLSQEETNAFLQLLSNIKLESKTLERKIRIIMGLSILFCILMDYKKRPTHYSSEDIKPFLEKTLELFHQESEAFGEPSGPPYPEIHEEIIVTSIIDYILEKESSVTNDYICEQAWNLLRGRETNSESKMQAKILAILPVTVAVLFISEVARNPLSFLSHLMLLDLIEKGTHKNHDESKRPYEWVNLLWCTPTDDEEEVKRDLESNKKNLTDMYGNKKLPCDLGGEGTMAHRGSYQKEFKKDKYQLNWPLTIARQKESNLFVTWLFGELRERRAQVKLYKYENLPSKITEMNIFDNQLNIQEIKESILRLDGPRKKLKARDSRKRTKLIKAEIMLTKIKPIFIERINNLYSYPKLLTHFGCNKRKLTLPKISHALWLMSTSPDYGDRAVIEAARQFSKWSRNKAQKKPRFSLKDIQEHAGDTYKPKFTIALAS